jgi:hypothetical protein
VVKLAKESGCCFLLALLGILFTGCGSERTSVDKLGGGYEEVALTRTSFSEPESHQISIQYKNSGGKSIMIWPSLESKVFIHADIAVFVALLGSRDSRFFAVKAPHQLMDITDEVLWRWSKESGPNFVEALKVASAATLNQEADKVDFRFAFWANETWPREFILDWAQISDIMHEVKEKGVVRKDRVWHTTYIQKEFKPEVQQ